MGERWIMVGTFTVLGINAIKQTCRIDRDAVDEKQHKVTR